MQIEEAIFSQLSNNAGVSALVASRIYPMFLDDDVVEPAIYYRRITTDVAYAAHDDTSPILSATFEINIIDKYGKYNRIRAISKAVRTAMNYWKLSADGLQVLDTIQQSESGSVTDDGRQFIANLDFIIKYQEN